MYFSSSDSQKGFILLFIQALFVQLICVANDLFVSQMDEKFCKGEMELNRLR